MTPDPSDGPLADPHDSVGRTMLVLGPGPGDAAALEGPCHEAVSALRAGGNLVTIVSPDAFESATDRTYHTPLTTDFLERVIATEKPRTLLCSCAGSAAMTAGLALDSANILRRYGVEAVGTPLERLRELREQPLGLHEHATPGTDIRKSIPSRSLEEALRAAEFLGYPVAVRGLRERFTAVDIQQFKEHVRHVLLSDETVLIEESVDGWQGVTVLALADRDGETLIVGDADHFDPLSSSEDEPILVAPAQSIPAETRVRLHAAAANLVQSGLMVGLAAVTFAVDRKRGLERAVTIEPGLGRLTALLGRLHDLPIGRLHAELTLGRSVRQTLPVTPLLQAIAVRLPPTIRRQSSHPLTPTFDGETRSGDALGLGHTFGEALQSALRSLGIGGDGLRPPAFSPADLRRELKLPGARRLLAIASALDEDWGLNQIHAATGIDVFFLQAIARTVTLRRELFQQASSPLAADRLWELKQDGFSDRAIAAVRNQSEEEIRAARRAFNITPTVALLRGDLSDERRAAYLGYRATSESQTLPPSALLFPVLGPSASLAGRSGDRCTALAIQEAAKHGYKSIVVSGDPWTNDDREHCRRRVVADLSTENLAEIRRLTEPFATVAWGAAEAAEIVWAGLAAEGASGFGTDANRALAADDPRRLAEICSQLGLASPDWREAADGESAAAVAELAGYPVLLRGSHGLTGGRTLIAKTSAALRGWFDGRDSVGRDAHATIAVAPPGELVTAEAVAQDGELRVLALTECIERLGTEDGRETTVVPAQRLSLRALRQIKAATARLAADLHVSGPLTVEFLLTAEEPLVIGCTLEFGRFTPLTRLATGVDLAQQAVLAALGLLPDTSLILCDADNVAVRLNQTRPDGPRAALSLAPTLAPALLLSFLSLGFSPPERRILLCIDDLEDLSRLLPTVQALQRQGAVLLATSHAHEFFLSRSVPTGLLHRSSEPRSPNVTDYVEQGRIDIVVAVPPADDTALLEEASALRTLAARTGITSIGDVRLLERLAEALGNDTAETLPCRADPLFPA